MLEASRPERRQPGEGTRRRRLGQRVLGFDHLLPGLLDLLPHAFDRRLGLLELLAGNDVVLEEMSPLVAPLDGRRQLALLQRQEALEGRPVLLEHGHDLGGAPPGLCDSRSGVGRPGRPRGRKN